MGLIEVFRSITGVQTFSYSCSLSLGMRTNCLTKIRIQMELPQAQLKALVASALTLKAF